MNQNPYLWEGPFSKKTIAKNKRPAATYWIRISSKESYLSSALLYHSYPFPTDLYTLKAKNGYTTCIRINFALVFQYRKTMLKTYMWQKGWSGRLRCGNVGCKEE